MKLIMKIVQNFVDKISYIWYSDDRDEYVSEAEYPTKSKVGIKKAVYPTKSKVGIEKVASKCWLLLYIGRLHMWKIENNRIQFIIVNRRYTDFLRNKIDSRIPKEHNSSSDRNRPYLGILIKNDSFFMLYL